MFIRRKERVCVCVCLMKYETAGEEVSDFFMTFNILILCVRYFSDEM